MGRCGEVKSGQVSSGRAGRYELTPHTYMPPSIFPATTPFFFLTSAFPSPSLSVARVLVGLGGFLSAPVPLITAVASNPSHYYYGFGILQYVKSRSPLLMLPEVYTTINCCHTLITHSTYLAYIQCKRKVRFRRIWTQHPFPFQRTRSVGVACGSKSSVRTVLFDYIIAISRAMPIPPAPSEHRL